MDLHLVEGHYRGHLPDVDSIAEAVCGCLGRVLWTSRRYGGHIHVKVTVPCRTGHPWQAGIGTIEHLKPEQIQPAQRAIDITMERAA